MKPPTPLKGKRFEQKPKRVVKAHDFHDHCGVSHNARLRLQLNEILDCIHNGQPIPDEYYSSQIDRQGDRLLRELGVKHLHLGGAGSDVIVYLAEFDTWVELIEINTHVHLESEPRGKDLKGFFRRLVAAAAPTRPKRKQQPRRSRHGREKGKIADALRSVYDETLRKDDTDSD